MITSDHSHKLFLTCPRRYALQKVIGTVPTGRASHAKILGIAGHAGLHSWYTHGNVADAINALTCSMRDETGYAKRWTIERTSIDEDTAYLKEVMQAYVRRYPTESWEVVYSEKPFVTVLGDECPACGTYYHQALVMGENTPTHCSCGTAIHYVRGILDLVVRMQDRGLLLIDHKFTEKQPEERFWIRNLRGTQLPIYCYAAGRVLQEPLTRAIINAIVLLKKVDKLGNPFKRSAVENYNQYDIESTASTFATTAARIHTSTVDLHYHGNIDVSFPKYAQSCVGADICPYVDVCWPSNAGVVKLNSGIITD